MFLNGHWTGQSFMRLKSDLVLKVGLVIGLNGPRAKGERRGNGEVLII